MAAIPPRPARCPCGRLAERSLRGWWVCLTCWPWNRRRGLWRRLCLESRRSRHPEDAP